MRRGVRVWGRRTDRAFKAGIFPVSLVSVLIKRLIVNET